MLPMTQRELVKNALLWIALASVLLADASGTAAAQTPVEAFSKGCGGCHSAQRVLRGIPKATPSERRAWLEQFMTQHPCERDDLKPLIIDYLIEKSGL
jgi:cytochrome c5